MKNIVSSGFEKGNLYEIKMPDDYEIEDFLKDRNDFFKYSSLSPIIDSFFFNSDDEFKTVENYFKKEEIINPLFNDVFVSMKSLTISMLSVKQKYTLSIMLAFNHYDYILISLEALSKGTINELFHFCKSIINNDNKKSFLFFNFSTTHVEYLSLGIEKKVSNIYF